MFDAQHSSNSGSELTVEWQNSHHVFGEVKLRESKSILISSNWLLKWQIACMSCSLGGKLGANYRAALCPCSHGRQSTPMQNSASGRSALVATQFSAAAWGREGERHHELCDLSCHSARQGRSGCGLLRQQFTSYQAAGTTWSLISLWAALMWWATGSALLSPNSLRYTGTICAQRMLIQAPLGLGMRKLGSCQGFIPLGALLGSWCWAREVWENLAGVDPATQEETIWGCCRVSLGCLLSSAAEQPRPPQLHHHHQELKTCTVVTERVTHGKDGRMSVHPVLIALPIQEVGFPELVQEKRWLL